MRQVLLYRDEDGAWIVEVPSLPGCRSDGDTREEALHNVKEAIELWIEVATERGWDIPDEMGPAEVVVVDSAA